ncbi:MAG: DUF1569 domain-containing protein [Planctomycetota bacterium]|nr:DUF1569 domain-containing protein [Planctomycetota bacterium]
MPVDTKNVANRRELAFADFDALLADVDRVELAARGGKARTLGNWSVAEILDHLAIAMEFAYAAPPFKIALPFKVVGRVGKTLFFRGFVRSMLKPGFKLPKAARAMEPAPGTDLDKSAARFRAAAKRLRDREPTSVPNQMLGRLTMDQLHFLHLRHAEMHLGFVRLD